MSTIDLAGYRFPGDLAMSPEAEEAMPVPACSGDGRSHGGEARVGRAVPTEAVGEHADLLEPTLPFPHQDGAGAGPHPALGCGDARTIVRSSGVRRGPDGCPGKPVEEALRVGRQVAEALGLQPVADQPQQQGPRDAGRRDPTRSVAELHPELREIEGVQPRQLVRDLALISRAA